MNSRTLVAAAFVVLCLALSGLVLHRQMMDHPVQADTGRTGMERADADPDGDRGGDRSGPGRWGIHRPADGPTRRAVVAAVQGQLDALRAGDGVKAWSYGSRRMRQRFGDPADFLEAVHSHAPAFSDSRSAGFGPVWTDGDGDRAEVGVTVRGPDGQAAQADYFLVREGGRFRIQDVGPGRPGRD